MTVTKDDFDKIWASTSPLTPYSFSASQYKEGWNFIGSTPPSRQMWDFLQKNNDEKMKYLADNYLPLSGGTATGTIIAPSFQTGEDASHYFQCRKFRGSGDADEYYHAIDFGHSGRDTVDFYEYGGVWNFYKCTSGKAETSTLVGSITATAGWNGLVKGQDITNYLPLSGGTLTGAINTANSTWNKLGDDASFGDHDIGGKMCVKSQTFRNTGIAFFDQTDKNVGEVDVNNAFDFNKPVKENGGFLVPIGVVQAFAGSTIPTGWLLCDGSAVSRTDYAALFAVIGTTYGAGNGSTTFNLPNLVDKFVEGSATAGTVKSAGLPNITGSFITELANPSESATGAFDLRAEGPYDRNVADNGGKGWGIVYIDASRSSSIYGNSNTVQPPALTMRYIIKY